MADDRLSEILKRQAAAAAAKRDRDARASEAAARAEDRREKAEAHWAQQSKELDSALAELNEKMAPNEIQLEKRWAENRGAHIDLVSIHYAGDSDRHSLRRLNISILDNGQVSVSMGTKNQSPAKQYDFALADASRRKWLDCLLDFVDVNTPK